MKCSNNVTLFIVIIVSIVVLTFFIKRGEKFSTGNTVPYYTTTFQAYPGKYMNYGSPHMFECLQRNSEYSGFRNCMLYFQ